MKHFKFKSILLVLGCTHYHKKAVTNEWIKRFNGKDMVDWVVKIYHHDVGDNFGNTFRAEDGMIKVRYDQYGDFNEQFGHLF